MIRYSFLHDDSSYSCVGKYNEREWMDVALMLLQTHSIEMPIANTQLHFKNLKSFDVTVRNTPQFLKIFICNVLLLFSFHFHIFVIRRSLPRLLSFSRSVAGGLCEMTSLTRNLIF